MTLPTFSLRWIKLCHGLSVAAAMFLGGASSYILPWVNGVVPPASQWKGIAVGAVLAGIVAVAHLAQVPKKPSESSESSDSRDTDPPNPPESHMTEIV
jgi:hypothetical protein